MQEEEKKGKLTSYKFAKEYNIGIKTLVEYLGKKGFTITESPNEKISNEMYDVLLKEYAPEKLLKEKAIQNKQIQKEKKEVLKKANDENQENVSQNNSDEQPGKLKILGSIDLNAINNKKTSKVDLFDSISKNTTPVIENTSTSIVNEKTLEVENTVNVENEKPKLVFTKKKKEVEAPALEKKEVVNEVKEEKEVKSQPKENKTIVNPVVNAENYSKVVLDTHSEEIDENHVIRAKDNTPKLTGPKILGKIDLPVTKPKQTEKEKQKEIKNYKDKNKFNKDQKTANPQANTTTTSTTPKTAAEIEADKKRKRKRKRKPANTTTTTATTTTGQNTTGNNNNNNFNRNKTNNNSGTNNNNNSGTNNNNRNNNNSNFKKEVPTTKVIGEQVKKTMANINQGPSRNRQKIRRDKRDKGAEKREKIDRIQLENAKILEVTEYLTANELAILMDISVNQVISKCLQLGIFVSINQRIEADVISLIAEEFGFAVKFISIEEKLEDEEEEDTDENLETRAPIVTVMGHVDHGKTSLLDYIRKANVIAGEAGGITQHIGAYEVILEGGKKITFLDTPGHEAFTAMRARGAKVTDIAIIVIAADDQVMPQTREAINHAQAAGVTMVFAINKVDKDGANSQKIYEQLANMNILVEQWGGKYQCQEISAKFGKGIEELLDKVLLEAEILDLKANPNRLSKGTIIEARLDKGRGVVTTVLVQNGTLKIGDMLLVNHHFGKVKAMYDERQNQVKSAGPSTPVQILGLNGVPQAGDKFVVMESERDAREIANKRQQIMREQNIRMQKHITLEEIARRRAVGNFKELNLIVKGDVDGSVEALSDSLQKLSTEEILINIILKGVGQISENDILLASASDAIIVGFQVRPSSSARKLAEQEQIDVRMYSIIYDAINEIKDALEGMHAPTIEEKILGTAEVRDVFKITKVGTVAGCMVTDGKIVRDSTIRLIRDGIVVHNGKIDALKRFKDDVKTVETHFECGISIEKFQDIRVGDIIEAFEQQEVKRKL